jgi:hypothetical protein
MRAASFRSRPISPTACAPCSPIREALARLPDQVREWLDPARARCCRRADELLVETFPRGDKHYLVCYPFEGGWRTRRSACC